jgi:transcriptional regulator with XRE-family HTH domain
VAQPLGLLFLYSVWFHRFSRQKGTIAVLDIMGTVRNINGMVLMDFEGSERERLAAQPAKDQAQRASIGKRLREARGRAGLTQVQLAESLDVAQPTVVGWEKGQRLPDVLMFVRLAGALGVPCQELVREQYPGAPLDPGERREWMDQRSDAFASRKPKVDDE